MNPLAAPVLIIGVGARTAVGMTAPATAAAVRAGIAGFANHPFVVDTAGNRMVVAAAPYLGMNVGGSERFAELAAPAACEAVSGFAAAHGPKPPVPVYVGVPPVRPGRDKNLPTVIRTWVQAELAAACSVVGVKVIETGHAAGAMAVKAAWDAIRGGSTEFALAGGVDSYFEAETLELLEDNDQVHSAGPDNNAYGFIPGEGAGFVLLGSEAATRRYDLRAALELSTAHAARETKLINTDSPCLGEGLTGLFRALSAGLPSGEQVDHLYCDMNGERYRATEFGFATIRAGKLFKDPSAFTTPADCWGDVGAASGPLFLMLAEAATRKGYAPGPLLAAFTSAESGERCGFVARSRAAQGVW